MGLVTADMAAEDMDTAGAGGNVVFRRMYTKRHTIGNPNNIRSTMDRDRNLPNFHIQIHRLRSAACALEYSAFDGTVGKVAAS